MGTDDPDLAPEDSPGLDAHGSVQPGDTPPDSAQTSGLSHPQPMPGRGVPIVAIVVVLIMVGAVAVFFVVRFLDLL